jgi:hypothetical protein
VGFEQLRCLYSKVLALAAARPVQRVYSLNIRCTLLANAGEPLMSEIAFFHVPHTCRHSVYWQENDAPGMAVMHYPCPWCWPDHVVDQDAEMIRLNGVLVFRALIDGRAPPWPSGMPSTSQIRVHHLPDDVCCKRAKRP